MIIAARFDVLIVGAGHAGTQAAIMLRQRKFPGSVALLGDEPDLPYERPPLSKEYLAGKRTFERLLIRPHGFYVERDITLMLGMPVVAVDAAAHTVTLADGTLMGYGSLIWAAGGTPRKLACSGNSLRRVHTVRTRADVDRMIGELPDVAHVVVIGGGYIGLEAAAVLTKLGNAATVLEAHERVLARVAGAPLSHFYEAEHRAHGVDLRTGVVVTCIEEADGAATGVRLADGEVIACDMVVVGIGIVPAVAPLIDAGAKGNNGVTVDGCCHTSLPHVYAIGDCAAHPNRFADGAFIRIESVQNATDQAEVVAKLLTGLEERYDAVPWFWSTQYDLKLQTVGLSAGHDRAIVRGDIAARSFSLVYMKRGKIIALDCVNAVRDFVQDRALVLGGASVDPCLLADADVSLNSLS